ncbi:WRC domain [Dillenia turbinata]|uniref:Growth-regulating factor n=1 Tax=Dillenia turbinata TaxID=194707 RepID=A0AAN8VW39_9MAGN
MNASSRFPFTATQWQELEHQALIYKYIISGVPIPPDLIFTIKRSLDSTISSKLFPLQHVGWNCFQMGFGRKVDPEPGRCRRTDGKKWRCSKEAFPDSKYCERHMHRGRNRSRKPVENMTTAAATPPTAATNSSSTTNINPSSMTLNPTSHSLSSLSTSSIASDLHQQYHYHHHASVNNTHLHSPFLYPYSSSSRPDIGLSTQDTYLFLDSGSYSRTDRDYMYVQGMKEEADEHAFFSEASGTVRSLPSSSMDDDHWQLTPLTMSSTSLASSKPSSGSVSLQSGYSHLQLKQSKESHHCYLMGSDFKVPVKDERDDEPQRTVHHFFDDEWPPKNRDSWLGSDDKSLSTTTQLSISIPNASHDFMISKPRSP